MDKKTINDSNNGLILFALPVRGDGDRGLRCDSLFDPSEGNRLPCDQLITWGSLQKRSLLYSVMHVLGGESVHTLDIILDSGFAGEKVGSILRKAT